MANANILLKGRTEKKKKTTFINFIVRKSSEKTRRIVNTSQKNTHTQSVVRTSYTYIYEYI